MSSERRESTRHKYTLPLRYTRGSNRVFSGRTVDLSQTGACLILDGTASSPHLLTLELGGKVTLLARTIWAERLPDGQQLVGVAFEGMNSGQRLAVADYLSELISRAA